MSAFDRQRQIELNIGKTFITAIGVKCIPFQVREWDAFHVFATIIASRNGREGSYFHI
jgi:hypothetical protein